MVYVDMFVPPSYTIGLHPGHRSTISKVYGITFKSSTSDTLKGARQATMYRLTPSGVNDGTSVGVNTIFDIQCRHIVYLHNTS